jgi:hypothetical protein
LNKTVRFGFSGESKKQKTRVFDLMSKTQRFTYSEEAKRSVS